MEIPQELRYSEEHEWVAMDDNIATIGITDHAQEQLGDIVYLELPETGTAVTKGDKFGVVESVKAVSDIYAPVSGMVVTVNTGLPNTPETVNEEPYGDGWMIRVEMSNPEELDDLMTAAEYEKFIEDAEKE
ncbi:MAG: glycine cleavage system protein GcvH [Deltaproteobacteria bacterium]|jgi:glycine cleavage system H protein|nr:glycine cleavage system protein GcvH [Deltaproteobacteria bacterium]